MTGRSYPEDMIYDLCLLTDNALDVIIENFRFMTLEQLSTEEQVLDLLDTAQTDLAMGFSFFGDMYRMQEDALCHGESRHCATVHVFLHLWESFFHYLLSLYRC